ncbi:hypothetical protein QJQ45_027156, partial [Haematococcus lacustris]
LPSYRQRQAMPARIRPMFPRRRWRIFPGDFVFVNHGQHASQSGKVLQVIKDRREPQVIVEGINLRKKKVPTGVGEDDFFVVTMEAPIHYSQVSLVEPAITEEDAQLPPQQRAVRAKFRYLADGTLTRIGRGPCASSASNPVLIPIPVKDLVSSEFGGAKDTAVAEVVRRTAAALDFAEFQTWARSRLPVSTS